MNLVPAMSIFYIVIGVLVVLLNIQQLPHVLLKSLLMPGLLIL